MGNHPLKCKLLALLLCATYGFAHAQPEQVRTGIYLANLYGLNMEEHSFYADFYIWFKWRGDIDPTHIEFVNSIEKWSMNNATLGNTNINSLIARERLYAQLFLAIFIAGIMLLSLF